MASIRTAARKEAADGVSLGGTLSTTHRTDADLASLFGRTGERPARENKWLICVPLESKGVTIARTLDKPGMRSSHTAEIVKVGRSCRTVADPCLQRFGEWGSMNDRRKSRFVRDGRASIDGGVDKVMLGIICD